MSEIEVVSSYDFGHVSLESGDTISGELKELEVLGLAQLKASLIALLKNDRLVRKVITDMVLHNPYIMQCDDGGCDDVDFL